MPRSRRSNWVQRASLLGVALSTTAVGALSPPGPQFARRSEGHNLHQLAKRAFTLAGPDDILKSYDYVIAGGGLAGLVIASRLSEDAGTSVLVLEAGLSGDARAADVNAPAGAYYASIVGSEYDWNHPIEPQRFLNGRAGNWPRGKILGGSTAMNAMYLVRPARQELDAWSNMLAADPETRDGSELWNWANLFEAMKKSENFTAPSGEAYEVAGEYPFSAANHGESGPMQLGYPSVMVEAVAGWLPALEAAGVPPLEAPNGGVTLGGFISPSSISPANYTRSYSRSAYIDSLPPRSNLHILSEATVTRLGFSDRVRAQVGDESEALIANRVEFGLGDGSTRFVVGVNREVVLAGGPMGSPKILMHSGVGPADVLNAIGLDVHLELPGVGQHLADHMTAGVVFRAAVPTGGDVRDRDDEFSRSPEFLSFINDAVGFTDIQRLFGDNHVLLQQEVAEIIQNATANDGAGIGDMSMERLVPGGSPEVRAGYLHTYNITAQTLWENVGQIEFLLSLISPGSISIQSAIQHPFSRGRVYINSTEPYDPIVIDPNYFSHPVDRTIIRQGVKVVREIGNALRTAGIVTEEVQPGPDVQSDEALDGYLTNWGANTQYHPAGSCAMLPRKLGGCVNAKLKVYGTANVRVADSSVYPFEFAAHLASATYGLAETAAEVLKEEAFGVPASAKIADSDLGQQGGGGGPRSGAREGGVAVGLLVAVLVGLSGVFVL
ncbi:mala s 12 allergen [Coprinopsis marcescibilis]|uniref:pyranose dehydrogenase (acceptor) n=1 Tax=Coprinopsis marcescibilis TaxID=230819 RepID=A0A5C3KWD2_COPMA|nr:mala s 12 allergen [Coprinopsis marcescibilis]